MANPVRVSGERDLKRQTHFMFSEFSKADLECKQGHVQIVSPVNWVSEHMGQTVRNTG